MNLFYALLGLFRPQVRSTGALPDPRIQEEKDKDWLHEERVLPRAADASPYRFAKITTSPYPYLNQLGTQACVPHAVALAERIERMNDVGVYTSPAPIFVYRQRSNYPSAGTWPPEAFALIAAGGTPDFFALPTPASEAEANAAVLTQAQKNEAAIYKGKSYFTFGTPNEIDAIASISEQGHAVPICLYATVKEWVQAYPKIIDPTLTLDKASVQHEVCVLPYSGFIDGGIKYLAVQDSAWFANLPLRYLSEDFIRARVYHAGYWDTVGTIGGGTRPAHHFTQTLSVGAQGNEVKAMQQLLISENLLPSDCATGFFGGLTLAGVKAFQNKYASEILTPSGLGAPTATWGPGCISKANALCGG